MGSIMIVVLAGAATALPNDFDRKALLQSIEGRIWTLIISMTHIFHRIFRSRSFRKADLTSMRRVMVGAAQADQKVMGAYIERGVGIVHSFGMTESTGGANLAWDLHETT